MIHPMLKTTRRRVLGRRYHRLIYTGPPTLQGARISSYFAAPSPGVVENFRLSFRFVNIDKINTFTCQMEEKEMGKSDEIEEDSMVNIFVRVYA